MSQVDEEIRAAVLQDGALLRQLRALDGGWRTDEQLRRALDEAWDRTAARVSPGLVRWLEPWAQPIARTFFEEVDVLEAELDDLRALAQTRALVLVPSHKSHLDYVLLSIVLQTAGVGLPRVVAGANLDIWPVGSLLRRLGAVFIPRSFDGHHEWRAVFERYLHELQWRGLPVEVFLEGGRSRTGRLRPPSYGVLTTLLDGAARRPEGARSVALVPVSLAYDRVPEAGPLVREKDGQPKRRETVGGLVTGVLGLLERRLGRVHLRFGRPIDADGLVRGDGAGWSEWSEEQRGAIVRRTGLDLLHRVGEAMVVVPASVVACALLGSRTGELDDATLEARVARWLARLHASGVPGASPPQEAARWVARGIAFLGGRRRLRRVAPGGWAVPPGARIHLEFFANQLVHHLAPRALAALAERDPDGDAPDAVRYLSRLWGDELAMDPDRNPEDALPFVPHDPDEGDDLCLAFAPLLQTWAHVLGSGAVAGSLDELGDRIFAALRDSHAGVRRPEAICRSTIGRALAWAEGEGLVATDGETVRLDRADALAHHRRLTRWLDHLDQPNPTRGSPPRTSRR